MRPCFLGFAFLVSLCVAQLSVAQPFVIMGLDQREYPTISANVIAFDASGSLQELGSSDISVKQDGSDIVGAVTTCGGQTSGRQISLMVLVDVSSSSVLGTPTPLDMAKGGAKAGELMLASTGDERGLATYDANTSLLLGLTTVRGTFAAAVDAQSAGKGSRLSDGLQNVPLGALSQLQNARNARALLVFTDGGTSIDLASTLATAKTFGIQVYIVGLNTRLSADLKQLADSTNGGWVENVITNSDASTHARAFVAHAKQLQSCTIKWTAPQNCAKKHTVSLRRGSLTRTEVVDVPVGILTYLSSNTTGLDFGEIPAGESKELSVTLTARNGAIQVDNISIADPHFVISSGAVPPVVTLLNNQAQIVRINYTATDSSVRVVPLIVQSDACETDTVYLRGGFVAKDNELRVVSPNGGESFLAGHATTIRWKGVLPTDIVRLESSTDDGTTWASISEDATGLKYEWLPGPAATTRGRIRVQRTSINETKIVTLGGQREPVYTADFTRDGKFVVTGGDDKTVRLYDAATGVLTRLVGTHTDWVWSVATHPTRDIVASASHDGTVRIWDYTTGARVATIPIGTKVWSVAFSTDGNTLYVGSSEAVASYNTNNWAVKQRSTVVSGYVYSAIPSVDGTLLAVAEDSVATVRDANTLVIANSFRGHKGAVYSAALSPDKSTLVTGGADFTVRLWNASNGTQTATTLPAAGSILSVRYSNDGSRILTGGGDGTAKFYSSGNLTLLGTLSGHQGLVYSARYDATNQFVTTASTDLTARVWDVQALRLAEDRSDNAFSIRGGLGTPATGDLGQVVLGEGADAKVLLLRNTSNDTLVINSIRIASGHVSDFDLIAPPTETVVGPNGELFLEVAFTPTQFGTRTAIVEFKTGTGLVRSTVTGNGTPPLLSVARLIDFGRLVANQQTRDTSVIVSLPPGSSAPVSVTNVRIIGADAAQYSIVAGGGAFTITSAQSHQIVLHFAPSDLGRFPAVLVLDLAGGSTYTTRLYGEGTGDATIQAVQSIIVPTELCRSDVEAAAPVVIQNKGNSTLQIYAIGLQGTNADEFTVETGGTIPIDIPANGSRTFTVHFVPKSTGVKTAKIVFTTNAVNALFGETVVSLIARKDTVAYELSRTNVSFDNVPEGSQAIERILLINTGTAKLNWPKGPIDLGSFLIESISPDIVGPGGQAEVVIRFKGGIAGQVYNGSYRFTDSVCSRSIDLVLSATVKTSVGFTIRIDSVTSLTGTEVAVPVYITNRVNFNRTAVRTATATFSTNATLLLPTGATPLGTIDGGTVRRFTMALPIPETDSLSTTLQFKTFWGNDSSAYIHIDTVVVADTLSLITVDGRVLLTDICREGGARLLAIAGQSASVVASWPQPMSNDGTVTMTLNERGATALALVDINGRVIRDLFQKTVTPGTYALPIDASELESGTYFLLLTTPTQRFAHRLDIMK